MHVQKLIFLSLLVLFYKFAIGQDTSSVFLSKTDSLTLTDINKVNDQEHFGTVSWGGRIVKVLVIGKDTLPVVSYDPIDITGIRSFENRNEKKLYHQWRHYAIEVYPYAEEAIRLYRSINDSTKNMSKRARKKYIKAQEKKLKGEYEDKLKDLTKTQGYILIKMVERELDVPFYSVIRELRGWWTATKWQSLGRWYGFNLKKGYNPEDEPILEVILQNLNISYDVPANSFNYEAPK